MAFERSKYIPFATNAIEAGFSFNKWQEDLIAHGMGRNRASLLSLWQDVLGMVKGREAMKSTALDDFPELQDQAKGPFRYTKEFVYKAEVTFQAAKGAPKESMFVTVISDDQLTKGEIIDQVRSKWTEWESGQQGRMVSAEPIQAIHWLNP